MATETPEAELMRAAIESCCVEKLNVAHARRDEAYARNLDWFRAMSERLERLVDPAKGDELTRVLSETLEEARANAEKDYLRLSDEAARSRAESLKTNGLEDLENDPI